MTENTPLDLTSTWGVDIYRNPGVGRFRKQQDAETWANTLVLASLESIPQARRNGPAYERAMQLLPHNQLARGIWLSRIRSEKHTMPQDWFPMWTIDQTRAVCEQTDAKWVALLDQLKDEHLSKLIKYTSSEGKTYVCAVEDILIHVYNHSTYHRGQIARLVTECGGQRAGSDFIAFTRKEQ